MPTFNKVVEVLEDVLWQSCGNVETGLFETLAIGSYEDAIQFLVDLGRLEWVKHMVSAKRVK